MEVEYTIIAYTQLTPDIFIPIEWPLSNDHNVILHLANEIIIQNDYEDPILQVNGIPARITRYVDEYGFYYIFKKISREEMCGSYVYDVIFSTDVNNNRTVNSTGTSSCTESCSNNYMIICYQVPPRPRNRNILNINPDAHASKRRATRNVKRCLNGSSMNVSLVWNKDGTLAPCVTESCTYGCFLFGVREYG